MILVALLGCGSAELPVPGAVNGSIQLVGGPVDDTFDIAVPQRGVRLMNGDIAYAVDAISGLIRVTDSMGVTVRFIGSKGSGPGEYTGVSWIMPSLDGLLVGTLDGRTLQYDGSGHYHAQLPLSLQLNGYFAPMRGDTLLVAQPLPTRARFGLPLHVMTLQGDTIRSFGAEDRSLDGSDFLFLYRSVARESDTTFWAIHPFTYQVERWSIQGELLDSFSVKRSWFPPGAATRSVEELLDEYRPAPRVRSIRQLADGNLLVLVERVKANPSPRPRSTSGETPARSSARMNDIDQVVEVIDSRTGSLIREIVNPGPIWLMGILSDSLMWGISGDAEGREQPRVFRLIWSAK